MHLSSHAFISAFLPLFVDTNSQQCFKNIYTKREKKSLLLSIPPRFARDTQEAATSLCLPIWPVFHSRAARTSRRLRQQTLLFTPLFVHQALRTQIHFSSGFKRAGKDYQK